MAAKDIFLQLRNAANTAFRAVFLTPTPAKRQVVLFNDGEPELLELLDSNGEIRDALISKRAKPRVAIVADETARFALTLNDVQNGDVVFQEDIAREFFVSDDTQLGVAAGYRSRAVSSSVTQWDDIVAKPTVYYVSSMPPPTASSFGERGMIAFEDDYMYLYVGDNTNHKWLRFLGTTF
jgi:hypothetical protein